jgi:hypothetical protein
VSAVRLVKPPVTPEVDAYIREVARQEAKRANAGFLAKCYQAFKMLADWCDAERKG